MLPTESFVATGADQDVHGQCLPDTDDPRGPRGSDHARHFGGTRGAAINTMPRILVKQGMTIFPAMGTATATVSS